jgi:ketosteroid isomerase-like protein
MVVPDPGDEAMATATQATQATVATVATVAALVDRQAVVDVVVRYATAVDRRDWALLRTCFPDRATFDFTSVFGGSASEMSADDYVANTRALISGFAATQHLSTNHVPVVTGDTATCVSEVQAYHVLDDGRSCTLGGHYTHALARTPTGWRMSSVTLTLRWEQGDRRVFGGAAARGRAEGGG